MRFPLLPIRYSIPGVLLLFGLLAGTISFFVEIEQTRQHELEEIIEKARFGGTSVASMLEYLFRREEIEGITLYVSQIGSDPHLKQAIILDENNGVLASTRYDYEGRQLTEIPAAEFSGIIDDVRTSLNNSVKFNRNRLLVQAVYPFLLPGAEVGLRPSRVGVIYLEYDFSQLERISAIEARNQAVRTTLAFFAVCIVLGVFFHFAVSKRAHRLVEITRRIGQGDLESRSDLTGRDELAGISDAVNEMAQRLRENQQFLNNIIENIPDTIFVKDARELRYVRFNQAGEELLGYEREELIGKSDHDFLPEDEADFFVQKDRETLEGGELVDIPEEKIQTRNLGERILHTKKIPITDESGKPRYLLGISEDITERKKVEEALKSAHEELERKVQERTQDLNEALGRAEAASHAKSDFLASMSHELRTPLNAIIGFSQALQERYFGELNDKQTEYVDDIQTSGQHLLSLINDVLDLTKVEAGKLELTCTPIDVRKLIDSSMLLIREKCAKHNINLSSDISQDMSGVWVVGDERKLKQVMFNLLSNAAKFTPDGGNISVEVNRRNGELLFSVSDTGIGLAPEDRDRIFEDFYQVRGGYADKTPGTGLGLPLTRSFVELHGGRIWAESEGAGMGSRFLFAFPVEPVPECETPDMESELRPVTLTGMAAVLGWLRDRIDSSGQDRHMVLYLFRFEPGLSKEALSEVDEVLSSQKRGDDLLVTVDGGRIYLVLSDVDTQTASGIIRRMKGKIRTRIGGSKVQLGSATFPDDGRTPEELLAKVAGESRKEEN